MGAWYFMKVKWDELGLSEQCPLKSVICRPESASSIDGFQKRRTRSNKTELLEAAMGVVPKTSKLPLRP